ncbi:major facilitator superfamily-domain-containing protein [Lophiotrema nucula]|uniref:Major facilitator superfamily-domain-containing protein n=1 Tax=Lophiotrema nucula TaxID=690887 RepID=A0A6A5YK11_9PLEO|nr:major facilitator superfamily-domain-containing protein [Lophiotrema nucula]
MDRAADIEAPRTTMQDQRVSESSSDSELPSPLEQHSTHPDAHASSSDHVSLAKTKSVAEQMPLLKEIIFVGILCSAQITTQMSLNGTLAILHVIGESLNITNPGVLSWLIAGYSLTVGSFILISGRFGDMFGYKIMIIIGFVWFGIWNIVCGCAVYSNEVLFIFGRVLSGIGPAILLPNALGLLGATYGPGMRKNMIFSLFGACAPGGAILGGVFAGVWNLIWWPWAFWTFAIATIILGIMAIFILPTIPLKPEVQNLTLKEKLVDLDPLGAGAFLTAAILFNFAWNQAPGFGWQNAYIYVLLIIGILLFPVFFWIELRVATKPLIPFDALSTDVLFVLGCVACGWASFGIWLYYIFQFLEILRGHSPLLTIAQMTPVAVSGFAAAITTGKVIHRLGPGWVMFIAMCAFTIGNILLATTPIHQTYWAQIFVAVVVAPWGMDMSFPAGTLILSNAVSKKHQGVAASLVNTVVNYSISIGVGIAGTVEMQVSGGQTSTEATLKGYRGALYLAIGMSGFGMLLAMGFLAKKTLEGKKEGRGGEEDEKVPDPEKGQV